MLSRSFPMFFHLIPPNHFLRRQSSVSKPKQYKNTGAQRVWRICPGPGNGEMEESRLESGSVWSELPFFSRTRWWAGFTTNGVAGMDLPLNNDTLSAVKKQKDTKRRVDAKKNTLCCRLKQCLSINWFQF